MKNSIKLTVAASALAFSAFVSGAASAQANNVAIADPALAITGAKALAAGYKQIATTYDANIKQIDAKGLEVSALYKQLDTNNDGQISEAEEKAAVSAKNPALNTITAKQNEIEQLTRPILLAQHYVVQTISEQYPAAQQKVVTAKKIGMIVSPDSLIWAPTTAYITADIATEIDKVLPAVSTTPPANWLPTRQTQAIHQQVQQFIAANSARQQQAAPQPAAAQPQGR